MFRKPRETVTSSAHIEPSTGRPPTPPSSVSFKQEHSMESIQTPSPRTSMPLLGRSKTTPKANIKTTGSAGGKASGKSNSSILSFFKKADVSPAKAKLKQEEEEEESLFIDDGEVDISPKGITQTPTPPRDQDLGKDRSLQVEHTMSPDSSMRYNEVDVPNKRRRISMEQLDGPTIRSDMNVTSDPLAEQYETTAKSWNGVKEEAVAPSEELDDTPRFTNEDISASTAKGGIGVTSKLPTPTTTVPTLRREPTSRGTGLEYDDNEDFIDDEYPEGEEYLERRWMEEQADLEIGLDDENHPLDMSTEVDQAKEQGVTSNTEAETSPSCPMCGGSFGTLSEHDRSRHVNDCLDGKAAPLPKVHECTTPDVPRDFKMEVANPKRFQRAAIARPGQENPFSLGASDAGGSSAFSKLMTGHAEDAAWATAAATEAQSRGKPAYQRTCPFYKILPGFSICVDAFRYGAVEGCKAYFLSHFHSDHYIGLTSSWCHGPIYCSRVTANLVRRQLRVDPRWVVDLEFEKKIEVPGTQVNVTMIPANHCPGSSLYLYEKVIGKGRNPKVQRVLHCGDFRACPAH
ncbi:MAG: hypothetical protein Q9226_007530, partial [Calogaya cf. arnoldii]